jgi:DNA-directed RNA polymerase beta subunit
MIDIKKLRLFPLYTTNLSVTKTYDNKHYNLIFYSENSTFMSAYPNLNIKKMFVRFGTILPNKIPLLNIVPKLLTQFTSNKIIPVRMNRPNLLNLFIDTSPYMQKLILRFKEGSYRRSMIMNNILSYLQSASQYYPDRSNILIYHVDINKPISDNFLNRKSFPLYMMFKDTVPFDYVLLAIQSEGIIKYALLKNLEKQLPVARIFGIFRNLKTIELVDADEQEKKEVDNYSNQVSHVAQNQHEIESEENGIIVDPDKSIVSDKMVRAVNHHINALDPQDRKNILDTDHIDPVESQKMIIKSSLFSLTRDAKKTEDIFNKINPKNYSKVIYAIKTDLAPSILEGDDYKNESRDTVYSKIHINGISDNKNPSRVLNKRIVDFQDSFESDLKKSFKILESKPNHPLKVTGFVKKRIPVDPGDLEPTKLVRYDITLQDMRGNKHSVIFDIPEIQSDGTFLINGSKKYLIYQLIKDPIYFIKEGEAVLQTMYASIATHHKLTKNKSYFVSHIAGYWLPTSLLFFYSVGFKYTMKIFGITYSVVDVQPQEMGVKVLPLSDGKFLVLKYSSKESEILINSMFEIRGDIVSTEIEKSDFWVHMMTKETGNRNSLFQINTVLENIMEPISVQVLKTKMLPTTFDGCMTYICKGLAAGKVDTRNDISKQRIRSSEIFNFQLQKLIVGSYSEYLASIERGNKDASYYCDAKQIISTIVNTSQMIRPIENINPYEELSSLTKVTPIGPGGLADENGVVDSARNIDASYYGNLDPMDTPENSKVGVINQLTIDAAVGNVRGSFGSFKGDDINSSVLSTTTSIIPFVSNDDGCRVMLSTSQTRQAIPIIGAEQPLVQTGYETILTTMLTDSYIKKSPVDGLVVRQSPNAIYVRGSKNSKVYTVPLDDKVLKSFQGKSSINYFHSVVKDGQKVSSGQIMAEGKHIQDGVISVGCNLLTAVMGWKGYSFEDGYIISEKIANQKFVSSAYEEIVINIKPSVTVKFIAKEGNTKKGEPLLIRASKEVEDLLDIDNDEIVEGQQITRSPGGKIIAIEIYPNSSIKKFPILETQFNMFRKRWEEMRGTFPEKFLINEGGSKAPFPGIRIVFKIERYDECVIGDKITNNHGGKGVLTYIEKDENMPVTPWGERIDIILNPIACINRMNPGTLYELYTGLIAKFMAKKLVAMGYKKTQQAMKLLANVYTAMDNTKNKSLSTNIIKAYLALSDKQYAQYIQAVHDKGDFLPIIVPPFKSPDKNMIANAMKIVGAQSAYNLKLPEYNTMTKNPVGIGYLYYKKLEKQASYLISARSVGKYDTSTGQPVAGSAHDGGQRIGEFDSWALISHGAETILRELFGSLSDDKKMKDELMHEIMQKGKVSYKESTASKTKTKLDVYLLSMMLDVKL